MSRKTLALGAVALSIFRASAAFPHSDGDAPATSPATAIGKTPPAASPLPAGRVENFRLLDHRGVSHELYRYSDRKAIVLISYGIGCPIIRKYVPTLKELNKRFGASGVAFLMIDANPQDDRKSLIREARSYEFDFPVMMDSSQVISERLGITRNSEVTVIDPSRWVVAYQGAVDDRLSYGADRGKASKTYLADALEALSAGRPVPVQRTEAKGCVITYKDPGKLTWGKDIAPILANRCFQCHAPGQVAPTNINSYEQVKGWAGMIRETLRTGLMPPPGGDPHYGLFRNELSLSPEQFRKVVKWVESGSPIGPGEDPKKVWVGEDLRHLRPARRPDVRFRMKRKFDVPADGAIEYHYETIAKSIPEDLWVTGILSESTNRNAIHHSSVLFMSTPVEEYSKKLGPGAMPDSDPNFQKTQIWAPARGDFHQFPKGSALKIPKGTSIVLENHYGGTGKPEKERTSVKFYLYRGQGEPRQIKLMQVAATGFEIPPGAPDFKVRGHLFPKLERPIRITSFLVHMHIRGKSIQLLARHPDGREETLFSLPRFDFKWQRGSILLEHKRVPAGAQLFVEGIYDNSALNPANPDPTQKVVLGSNSMKDEMCKVNISYYEE